MKKDGFFIIFFNFFRGRLLEGCLRVAVLNEEWLLFW